MDTIITNHHIFLIIENGEFRKHSLEFKLYFGFVFQEWRTLMGPTKVFRSRFTDPETIRGQVGLTDTRNSTHGSDSDETARQEMKFFFPKFDPDLFFVNDSKKIPENNFDLHLDKDNFVHRIV